MADRRSSPSDASPPPQPPESAPPPLFKAAQRRAFRDRAARSSPGIAETDYLHREVAAALAERLEPIRRTFPAAAVFGAATGVVGDTLLGGSFGVETLVEIESSPVLAAKLAERRSAPHRVIVGEADPSPLAHNQYDLVISSLDFHAAADLVGSLVQARLALKPDGLFIGVFPGGETLLELRDCLAAAEVETSGGLSPRVAPMGELRDLGSLLQRAGFALPVADSDRIDIWFDTALDLMRDLRAMGEANALTLRNPRFLRRDTLARTVALYADRHARADGRVRATVELVTLTGWAPAEGQQKALRPGSAAQRLADALGSEERPAGDKAPG